MRILQTDSYACILPMVLIFHYHNSFWRIIQIITFLCKHVESIPYHSNSTTPTTLLPKIHPLILHYENLYHMAMNRDFNFAEMGQKCEPLSPNDIQEALKFPSKAFIFREKKLSKRKIRLYLNEIRSSLLSMMRFLFSKSRSICNFHHYLICDGERKRCTCTKDEKKKSLTIMIPDRDGMCRSIPDELCVYSRKELHELGILTVQNATFVDCLPFARCMLSTKTGRHYCRCLDDYSDKECFGKAWQAVTYSKTIMQKILESQKAGLKASSKSTQNSIKLITALVRKSFGVSMDNLEKGFFLDSDEIKDALVKLMKTRSIHNPVDRRIRAEQLYATMIENEMDLKALVVNDIYVRALADLTFNATCQPTHHKILKKFYSKSNATFEEIAQWQKEIIVQSTHLCNFILFLTCDEPTRRCVCYNGMIFDSSSGRCALRVGETCYDDYMLPFPIFDSLLVEVAMTRKPPLKAICNQNLYCKRKPMFFKKRCWCFGDCSRAENTINKNYENAVQAISNSYSLTLEEYCHYESEKLLLRPEKSFSGRLNVLFDLKDKNARLCKLNKSQRCSKSEKKCVCFGNLVKQNATSCLVKNLNPCLSSYGYGKTFHFLKMSTVQEVLGIDIKPDCIQGAKCTLGITYKSFKCACKSKNKAGYLCDEPKSQIAAVFDPFKVLNDGANELLDSIFMENNRGLYKLESMSKLEIGNECNITFGKRLNRIVRFWKHVASENIGTSSRRNFHHFNESSRRTHILVSSGIKELCNPLHGLECRELTKTCQCAPGTQYLNGKCVIKRNNYCDHSSWINSDVGQWLPQCSPNSKCSVTLVNFRKACKCKPGYDGTVCEKSNINSQHASVQKEMPSSRIITMHFKTSTYHSTQHSGHHEMISPGVLRSSSIYLHQKYSKLDFITSSSWRLLKRPESTLAPPTKKPLFNFNISKIKFRAKLRDHIGIDTISSSHATESDYKSTKMFVSRKVSNITPGNTDSTCHFRLMPKLPLHSFTECRIWPAFVFKLRKMFLEMLRERMMLQLYEKCFPEEEAFFKTLFLPIKAKNILISFEKLRYAYLHGYLFCHPSKLHCTKELKTCSCDESKGFIEFDGHCFLKKGEICGKKRHIFKCVPPYVCNTTPQSQEVPKCSLSINKQKIQWKSSLSSLVDGISVPLMILSSFFNSILFMLLANF